MSFLYLFVFIYRLKWKITCWALASILTASVIVFALVFDEYQLQYEGLVNLLKGVWSSIHSEFSDLGILVSVVVLSNSSEALRIEGFNSSNSHFQVPPWGVWCQKITGHKV